MQLHTSYNGTFKAAVTSQAFAAARLYHIKLPMNIDTSGCYKLFYFMSGGKKFHIDHYIYDIQPGDLFMVNQREWHYFSQISKEVTHERIVIFIYPDFLKSHCSEQTDLFGCFSLQGNLPGHKLPLQPKERDKFLYLIHKLSSFKEGFGQDIMDRSVFLELMVFVNRLYHHLSSQNKTLQDLSLQYGQLQENISLPSAKSSSYHYQPKQVKQILTYIDHHITEDLSLEILSKELYLTPSYLCRIFKNSTGTTIHKYITANRITLAKDLLALGYSVTDACSRSGFKDYNGFLKSFVETVGVTPKKYAQFSE